jgi:glycerophosphoryl diester phosphodiesterase
MLKTLHGFPVPRRMRTVLDSLLLIGHRGSSYVAPENTLAAFRLAWAEGADGIEADFRLTGDGQIVCCHDTTTGRTAGIDLAIAGTPLARLRRLDVGAWKGADWAGERIPTLTEVIAELPAEKKLFIELKSGPEIIAPLARELAATGVSPEQIRLLAFNVQLVADLRENLPAFKACLLTDYRISLRKGFWRPSREEVLATLWRTGAAGLASRGKIILDEDFAAELRRAGMEIHIWTVDDPATARRFRQLGVDSIMTNRPGWLRHRLSTSASPGM